ncbi:MAG TPA: SDR family oxidoreductase [Myxococcaceae bacterium]|nr:SDR family oxidoreductase [Myxococcaceae bacterium]
MSASSETAGEAFLVTGAASGIGRHLAGALAAQGHRVLATDVDAAALFRARAADRWPEASLRLRGLDVRRAADWEDALAEALETFGRLDVLLNVAGVLKPGAGWASDEADVDFHVDVNLKGVIHGTRIVGRHFVARRTGHIVNFGSLASLAPVPGLTLYSASKFGVRGFSLASAQELAEHGVAMTLVMPDAVQTPMLDLQVDFPEAALTFSGAEPLTVEDIERLLVEQVLPKRPLEVAVPFSRGALARLSTVWPAAATRFAPTLTRKGRAAQARIRKRRGSG